MADSSWSSLLGLVGVVVGGGLSFFAQRYHNKTNQLAEERRLLVALFGELINIKKHYTYASQELPIALGTPDADLALRMSKYGSLAFFKENVSRLGFLSDQDIADLMQLSLVVRNNDVNLDFFAGSNASSLPQASYSQAAMRRRMAYTLSLNETLLNSLAKGNPSIRPLLTKAVTS